MNKDMEEAWVKPYEKEFGNMLSDLAPTSIARTRRKGYYSGFKAGAEWQAARDKQEGWIPIDEVPEEFKKLYNLVGGHWVLEEDHEPFFDVYRISWTAKKKNWFADGDSLTPTKATHAMLPLQLPKKDKT